MSADPRNAGPAGADPRNAEPVGADPRNTEPGNADPMGADPGNAEPAGADPRNAEPVGADPGNADPMSADPMSADPMSADPGNTGQRNADPGNADPVNADPVNADPGNAGPIPAERLEALSALAAGELDEKEARLLRQELRRDPALARLYGEFCLARRALSDFAAAAEAESGASGSRPELRERILAATLPAFRKRYRRRAVYWPTWVAAAAAILAVALVRPPPLDGALDRLFEATGGVGRLAEAATDTGKNAAAELDTLRASLGAAFDDRMDRLGDRLRDLEEATRGPGPAETAAPAEPTRTDGDPLAGPPSPNDGNGETAP